MNHFKVILWDNDGTLLDFHAAQAAAIRRCFELFGLGECSDPMLADYDGINDKYWKALERGELTKQEVLEGRFHEFFRKYGIPEEPIPAFNEEYQLRLGDTIVFFPGAPETLAACSALGLRQYGVTNGTKRAQDRKLRPSGLGDRLDGVFISDEIGCEKPDSGFFAPVFAALGDTAREDILIVGDSLTSDMQGGLRVGIRTCWFRHPGKENTLGLPLDYVVDRLPEVLEIISGEA